MRMIVDEDDEAAGPDCLLRVSFAAACQLGALRPQKPLRLIRDGEVGGDGNLISNTYSLHCHPPE